MSRKWPLHGEVVMYGCAPMDIPWAPTTCYACGGTGVIYGPNGPVACWACSGGVNPWSISPLSPVAIAPSKLMPVGLPEGNAQTEKQLREEIRRLKAKVNRLIRKLRSK